MGWLSVFCVLLLSFESNGQGDEEGWRHEGHEEGDEEMGSASCGQASCEAQEGHEEGDEGSEESEEGLNELSMTPLEGQPLFKAVGSPCLIYRRTVSRKISNEVADDSCLGQD